MNKMKRRKGRTLISQVNVRVSPNVLAALKLIAEQERRTIAQVGRMAIEEYIEKKDKAA